MQLHSQNASESMRHLFPYDQNQLVKKLGKEALIEALRRMLLIRNFETRAEAAYQQGKVGGFFHSYIGQEAIQTAVCKRWDRITGISLLTVAMH